LHSNQLSSSLRELPISRPARTVVARCASSPPSKTPQSLRPSSLTSHCATGFATHSHARRHPLSTTTTLCISSDHPILAVTSAPFGPRPASASNRPPNSRPFSHFARNSRSYRSTAALTHAAGTCTMASTAPLSDLSARDMSSCAEARFHLESCGLTRLDGDGDGVPCEAMCR